MEAPFGRTADTFGAYLTPRRIRYAFIIAGAMWLSWTVSVLLGPGNFDLAGQAVGADFTQYYSAGHTVRSGQSAHLYDPPYQQAVEHRLVGPELQGFHAFVNPPFFAWVFALLSYLPYQLAFVLWSALGLTGLFFALRAAGLDPRKTLPWALTFFPVFAAVSFGQNSLLSLALLAATYVLWRARRLVLAGLVLSLLLYKPQLVLGVLLLWGLGWRRDWRSLMGFGAGALTLAAGTFVFMPEASAAYVEFSRTTLPNLMSWGGATLWHMHTVRGFFQLLLPGTGILPTLFAGIVGVAAICGFAMFWRSQKDEPALVYAAALVLTFLITPHAMVYEWAILVLPAALLWKALPGNRQLLRAVFATLWLTMLGSGWLAKFQIEHLPITLQFSIPILLIVTILMWQRLIGEHSLTPTQQPLPQPSTGAAVGVR